MANFFGDTISNFLDISKFKKWIKSLVFSYKSKYIFIHLLCDTNSKIFVASKNIVPADLLSHQRLEVCNANACNLPGCCSIEEINRQNSSYELNQHGQRKYNRERPSIVDDFCGTFFPCCICSKIV